jgi:hypothetical protein
MKHAGLSVRIPLGLALSFLSVRAEPCVVEELRPFSRRAAASEAVFIGKVVARSQDAHNLPRLTVDVLDVVKGDYRSRRVYMTSLGSGVCDADLRAFVPGSVWAFVPGVPEPPLESLRVQEHSFYRVERGTLGTPDPVLVRRVRRWARGHTGD